MFIAVSRISFYFFAIVIAFSISSIGSQEYRKDIPKNHAIVLVELTLGNTEAELKEPSLKLRAQLPKKLSARFSKDKYYRFIGNEDRAAHGKATHSFRATLKSYGNTWQMVYQFISLRSSKIIAGDIVEFEGTANLDTVVEVIAQIIEAAPES